MDSLLLIDTDIPKVLRWLRENLPTESCWSRGVELDAEHPTAESDRTIDWVMGADVLNIDTGSRGAAPGEEMLTH